MASIGEVFKDRRVSNRERLAHDRQRQVRQEELQRATLLDLQDAVLALINQAGDLLDARFLVNPDSAPEPKARQRVWQAEQRVREAQAKVSLLSSRVLDDKARHDLRLFVALTQAFAASEGRKSSDLFVGDVSRLYVQVMDRLGELIRERP